MRNSDGLVAKWCHTSWSLIMQVPFWKLRGLFFAVHAAMKIYAIWFYGVQFLVFSAYEANAALKICSLCAAVLGALWLIWFMQFWDPCSHITAKTAWFVWFMRLYDWMAKNWKNCKKPSCSSIFKIMLLMWFFCSCSFEFHQAYVVRFNGSVWNQAA